MPNFFLAPSDACNSDSVMYAVIDISGVEFIWDYPSDWETVVDFGDIVFLEIGSSSGTVQVTSFNECGMGPINSVEVNVEEIPNTPFILGDTTPCSGTTQLFSISADSGATYIWDWPVGWGGAISVPASELEVVVDSIPGYVTVYAENACGEGAVEELLITPESVPGIPSVITGPANPCQWDTVSYSITMEPGISYTWWNPSDWTEVSTLPGIFSVEVGTNPGSIAVVPSNDCGIGPVQYYSVISETAPEQPDPISGDASVCVGDTITYSVLPTPGVTYGWLLPVGWSMVGTPSNSITVIAGSDAGLVSVIPANDCGSGLMSSLAVSVSNVPYAPAWFVGSETPCVGSIQTYSVAVDSGVSYDWSVPVDWSIISNSGDTIEVLVGMASGEVQVIPTNACGNGIFLSKTVSPDYLIPPSLISSGGASFCEGDSSILSVAGSFATYQWYKDSLILSGATNIDLIVVGLGEYYVVVTDADGCLGSSETVSITLLAAPELSLSDTILQLCQGDEVPIIASGAEEYSWSPSVGLDSDTGTVVIASPSVDITYSVTGTNSNGCSDISSVAVVVHPLPEPVITDMGGFLLSSPAGSYHWFVNGIELTGYTTQIIEPPFPGTYTLVVSDENGCIGETTYLLTSMNDTITGSVLLYPNPTQDKVEVRIEDDYIGEIRIEVYDLLGRKIEQTLVNKDSRKVLTSLFLGRFANSTYLVKVIVGERSVVKKLVKN